MSSNLKSPSSVAPCEIDRFVGQRIASLIESNAGSRLRIAELLGVDTSTLDKMISGSRRVRAVQLISLMDEFHLPAGYFFKSTAVD